MICKSKPPEDETADKSWNVVCMDYLRQ
jgi:hypothetical protein